MIFVTQTIPEDKKEMVEKLCREAGMRHYSPSEWAINSENGDFLICLTWQEGREPPTRPGLWLFIRKTEVVRLRIQPTSDWGQHIDGIHRKLTVTDGYEDGASIEKIKDIQSDIKNALTSSVMAMAGTTQVMIDFGNTKVGGKA